MNRGFGLYQTKADPITEPITDMLGYLEVYIQTHFGTSYICDIIDRSAKVPPNQVVYRTGHLQIQNLTQ